MYGMLAGILERSGSTVTFQYDKRYLQLRQLSPEEYPNLAENERAKLILMGKAGFPVPPCGLLKLKDEHLIFIIRRYDRNFEIGEKIHQEDAMQALGITNADSSRK
jgi:serine/threonine-protein kinase HipA